MAAPLVTTDSELQQYLRHLVSQCSHTHHIGLSTERISLDLERVFVPLRGRLSSQAAAQYEAAVEETMGVDRQARLVSQRRVEEARARVVRGEQVDSREVVDELAQVARYEERLHGAKARLTNAILWPLGDAPARCDALLRPLFTRRLLIVGHAGTGKTTLCRYTALRLAETLLDPAAVGSIDELGVYFVRTPVPVYVRLTHFASTLPRDIEAVPLNQRSRYSEANAQIILEFLNEQIGRSCPTSSEFISRTSTTHQFLFIFDGLDEAGSEAQRIWIAKCLERFSESRPQDRVLITTRPGAVRRELGLGDFPLQKVLPLSRDDQEQLLTKWFAALGARSDQFHSSEAACASLLRAIETSPSLEEMAANPLLLTCMAIMLANRLSLPDQRAMLYDELVKMLLDTWRRQQTAVETIRSSLSGAQMGTLRRRLEQVAFGAQTRNRGARTFSVDEATAWLRSSWPSAVLDIEVRERVVEMLESLSLDSGLLIAEEHGYQFAHLTFQEFLAACHLIERVDALDLLSSHRTDARWREVALLAFNRLSNGSSLDRYRQLVEHFLRLNDEPALALVASATLETGSIEDMQDVAENVASALAFGAKNRAFSITGRIGFGTLAWRLGRDLRAAVEPDRDGYWSIPLTSGVRVARYPITCSDYLAFLLTLSEGERASRRPYGWTSPSVPENPGYPVVLRFDLAEEYAGWVSDRISIGRAVVASSVEQQELIFTAVTPAPPSVLRVVGVFPELTASQGVEDHRPYSTMREWRRDVDFDSSQALMSSFRLVLVP